MTDAPLLSQTSNGVTTFTLNRPAVRNAMSLELVRAFAKALESFAEDDAAHVAILTGADPAFCAGLDIKEFSSPDAPRAEVTALITSLPTLPKPIIAAVNGAAYTGGLELALGCDFIIASERARFADTHLKIGALAGSGMNSRLTHTVGSRWAKQLALASDPIDAATALRIGLVNEVVPHDDLLARVAALAALMAQRDSALLALTRDVINKGAAGTLTDALRAEADALAKRKAGGGMTWTS